MMISSLLKNAYQKTNDYIKEELKMKNVKVKAKRYPASDDVVYAMGIVHPDDTIRHEAALNLEELIHDKLVDEPFHNEYRDSVIVLSDDFSHGDLVKSHKGINMVYVVHGKESVITDSKIAKLVAAAVAKARYEYQIKINVISTLGKDFFTDETGEDGLSPTEREKMNRMNDIQDAIKKRGNAPKSKSHNCDSKKSIIHPDFMLSPSAEAGYVQIIKSIMMHKFQPDTARDEVDMSKVYQMRDEIIDVIRNNTNATNAEDVSIKDGAKVIITPNMCVCITDTNGKAFSNRRLPVLAYFIMIDILASDNFDYPIIPIVVNDDTKIPTTDSTSDK